MIRVTTLKRLTGLALATTMLAGAPIAQASETFQSQRTNAASGLSGNINAALAPQDRKAENPGRGGDRRANNSQRAQRDQAPRRIQQREVRQERRDVRQAQRDVRSERRDVRQAQQRVQEERRDVRQAQRNERQNDRQVRSWRSDRDDRNRTQTRNRTYADNDRNRTYSSRDRDDRRDRNWRDQRRDNDRWRDNNRRYSDSRNYRDQRRWKRDWRQSSRYDWHNYRARHRNIYRVGRYYTPYRDYRYRRLSIGFSLGSLFYSSRYWINDPWRYRLPEVYGPYRWVRYYDDVLLVDIYNGEVVDVIYDFFW